MLVSICYDVIFEIANVLLQVMDKLSELKSGPTQADVVIVGGGYAGVELAATVAEMLGGQGRVKVKPSPTVKLYAV